MFPAELLVILLYLAYRVRIDALLAEQALTASEEVHLTEFRFRLLGDELGAGRSFEFEVCVGAVDELGTQVVLVRELFLWEDETCSGL